jgi:hypothetical protein
MAKNLARIGLILACLALGRVYAADDEVGTIAIGGVVKDAAGQPVPGATVRVAWTDLALGDQRFLGPPEISGDDGSFRFHVERDALYAIEARGGGGAVGVVARRYSHHSPLIDVVLVEGFMVNGCVLDEAGVPVVGATVASFDFNNHLACGSELLFTAMSAHDGSFSALMPATTEGGEPFATGRAGQDRHIVVHAAGYAPLVAAVSEDAKEVTLVMKRGVRLSGRVLSVPNHQGVAGVAVVCAPLTRFGIQWVMTDDKGRFEFSNLIGGYSTLRVSGAEWVLAGQPVAVDVDAASVEQDILLYARRHVGLGTTRPSDVPPSGNPIIGRVVDETGTPVEGARVRAESDKGTTYQTKSSADGTFELYGYERREQASLYASCEGYLAAYKRVVIAKSGLKDPTLVMPRAGTVRGRVLDSCGKPFLPVALSVSDIAHGRIPTARPDAAGIFELQSVEPGTRTIEAWLWRFGEDGLRVNVEVKVMAGETSTVDIVLPPLEQNAISGWVRDDLGRPVPGVRVGPTGSTGFNAPAFPTSVTDSDGHFTVRYYGPGPCKPFAHVGNVKSGGQEHAPAGDGKILLTVTHGFRIRGRVLSEASGEPIPVFEIGLCRGAQPTAWRLSERHYHPEGAFSISSPWPGDYTVMARADDGAEAVAVVTVVKGEPTAEVVLRVR